MPTIPLKFVNGLNFAEGVRDILAPAAEEFRFVESETPEVIIFGPYGGDLPPSGGPVRVGYFCENMLPDMSICEWAFGIPLEEEVGDSRYMRLEWHGVDPARLVKKREPEPAEQLRAKSGFCNFLYSNHVSYRERFFRELSKYKRVDAPGSSMNNMPSIDTGATTPFWETKRNFLGRYKFTIAFENDVSPGYHTEKILDPMLAGSLPIYFGDPRIAEHFNPLSFVNAREFMQGVAMPVVTVLDRWTRQTFRRGPGGADYPGRLARKLRGQLLALKLRLRCWDFSRLIARVIEIDRNDDLYLKHVAQPWFVGNRPPATTRIRDRWREIFQRGTAGR